jgi:hypothetical protein
MDAVWGREEEDWKGDGLGSGQQDGMTGQQKVGTDTLEGDNGEQ